MLMRWATTSTCPGGRAGCRERYALRPVKTRSREVKRERAIARVRCSAESARAPFYKEAPTVPAPRRAHECPMSSAGAVRCCCAFLRARLAPLTTAHRQGLEKLGKGSEPRSRLAHHPRPSPISRIACSNGHALTGNGQLHMPEPQLQLLRSDNTSTCPIPLAGRADRAACCESGNRRRNGAHESPGVPPARTFNKIIKYSRCS